jgi:hypothetical protein
MQKLLVWTTASSTSEATLEFGSDDSGVGATEMPAWASGALRLLLEARELRRDHWP